MTFFYDRIQANNFYSLVAVEILYQTPGDKKLIFFFFFIKLHPSSLKDKF